MSTMAAGTVRRGGSFIYEEFLATGGTDVKVRQPGGATGGALEAAATPAAPN